MTTGSGTAILIGILALAGMALAFTVVPLVECHRCDSAGQFSRDAIIMGKPAIYIDYCDCATFWILPKTGKRGKISLLRSLMKPQSLRMDRGDGKGYKP